jgi:hypothetical protein
MVADAGFAKVEVVQVYSLALRYDAAGPWRAVMRAWPAPEADSGAWS